MGLARRKPGVEKWPAGFFYLFIYLFIYYYLFFFHFACRSSRCSDPKLTERLEQANESAKCINLHQYACASETVQCAK